MNRVWAGVSMGFVAANSACIGYGLNHLDKPYSIVVLATNALAMLINGYVVLRNVATTDAMAFYCECGEELHARTWSREVTCPKCKRVYDVAFNIVCILEEK